jgi:SAM-dependent methyltransferase
MNKFLLEEIEKNPSNAYLAYHAKRYDFLLAMITKYHNKESRILDIGRSPFTAIAHREFGAPIDTLGFEADGKTETGLNFNFDLNDAADHESWRSDLPKYNTIIFSEVIEHLYTSPIPVLRFLKSILCTDGIIIIQTPNAVVLHKRLIMLAGRNPYSLISVDRKNPSHFREYTAKELREICTEAGFFVEELRFENYFDYRYANHAFGDFSFNPSYRIINFIYDILPDSFKPGLCCIVRA